MPPLLKSHGSRRASRETSGLGSRSGRCEAPPFSKLQGGTAPVTAPRQTRPRHRLFEEPRERTPSLRPEERRLLSDFYSPTNSGEASASPNITGSASFAIRQTCARSIQCEGAAQKEAAENTGQHPPAEDKRGYGPRVLRAAFAARCSCSEDTRGAWEERGGAACLEGSGREGSVRDWVAQHSSSRTQEGQRARH